MATLRWVGFALACLTASSAAGGAGCAAPDPFVAADLGAGAPGDLATAPGGDLSSAVAPDLSPLAQPDLARGAAPARIVAGYYESWSEPWMADGAKSPMARMAEYVNVIILSFARPDATYAGGDAIAGTGLQFPWDGATLRQAVTALRANRPATKLLVAVGGATYTNWQALDAAALARFVTDYKLDGVDVDFEPANPACAARGGVVSCASDAQLVAAVDALRKALPRPALLSIAAWSTGAYGEGSWANGAPQGDYSGLLLNLLKSPSAASLDWLNVMSYDASNAYDPVQALAAYQNYFKGPVVMGVEVPPEAWGGHVYSLGAVDAVAAAVVQKSAGGMMIWSLQKQPNGPVSAANPSATLMAQEICGKLSLGNCAAPLW